MSDIDKKQEVGYKIKDTGFEEGKFVVRLETPTPDLKTRVFRFSDPEMMDSIEYVEDGEIKEDPRWKIRVKNSIEDDFETERKFEDKDKPDIEGEVI